MSVLNISELPYEKDAKFKLPFDTQWEILRVYLESKNIDLSDISSISTHLSALVTIIDRGKPRFTYTEIEAIDTLLSIDTYGKMISGDYNMYLHEYLELTEDTSWQAPEIYNNHISLYYNDRSINTALRKILDRYKDSSLYEFNIDITFRDWVEQRLEVIVKRLSLLSEVLDMNDEELQERFGYSHEDNVLVNRLFLNNTEDYSLQRVLNHVASQLKTNGQKRAYLGYIENLLLCEQEGIDIKLHWYKCIDRILEELKRY
ncbi:hypothetical protein ABGV42_00920 [Paenibacillus pabuli]|uniref:hypothetical protein n=1 Tax=Paenibacillus pabuli TaxID=1472 RepID=UPI003241C096